MQCHKATPHELRFLTEIGTSKSEQSQVITKHIPLISIVVQAITV